MTALRATAPRAAATAAWLAWLVALGLGIVLLELLARGQLRAHLLREAQDATSAVARGGSPWHWRLRYRSDLVGRRVFGLDTIAFGPTGLELTGTGESFEIGLPIRRAIDLRRFSKLEIRATASGTFPRLFVVVRETAAAAARTTEWPVAHARWAAQADLGRLPWRDTADRVMPAPVRAEELRLRILLDKGTTLHIHSARLMPAQPLRVPPRDEARALDGYHAGEETPLERWRLLIYDVERVEHVLAAVDRANTIAPSSLIVHFDDVARITEPAGPSTRPLVQLVGLLALTAALALIRLRPPRARRTRALLEAAGAVAGPLWLIVGGHIGDNVDVWTATTIAVSVIYVASLAFDREGRSWHWLGTPRSWLLAGIPVLIAALLAMAWHTPGSASGGVDTFALLRYVPWAFAQQWLICVVVADRLEAAELKARWVILVCAVLFALLHTPNAALMQATLLGGLAWTTLWLRERALLPIVVSHAVAATLFFSLMPPGVLRSAEVSLRYFL